MPVAVRQHVPSDIAATFTESLSDLGVEWESVPVQACESAIESMLDGQAIGVSHTDPSVTLPPSVTTDPTVGDLETATTGVTPASFGIAEYGSVFLADDEDGTEPISLFTERHVGVLRESDIHADMETAVEHLGPDLRDGGSGIIATGPSATADMGALVKGAHGPREVGVVIVSEDGA